MKCKAITLKGERCKNNTVESSKYCHLHRWRWLPNLKLDFITKLGVIGSLASISSIVFDLHPSFSSINNQIVLGYDLVEIHDFDKYLSDPVASMKPISGLINKPGYDQHLHIGVPEGKGTCKSVQFSLVNESEVTRKNIRVSFIFETKPISSISDVICEEYLELSDEDIYRSVPGATIQRRAVVMNGNLMLTYSISEMGPDQFGFFSIPVSMPPNTRLISDSEGSGNIVFEHDEVTIRSSVWADGVQKINHKLNLVISEAADFAELSALHQLYAIDYVEGLPRTTFKTLLTKIQSIMGLKIPYAYLTQEMLWDQYRRSNNPGKQLYNYFWPSYQGDKMVFTAYPLENAVKERFTMEDYYQLQKAACEFISRVEDGSPKCSARLADLRQEKM